MLPTTTMAADWRPSSVQCATCRSLLKSALRSRRSALAATTGGRMEPVSRTVHHALGRLLAEDGGLRATSSARGQR